MMANHHKPRKIRRKPRRVHRRRRVKKGESNNNGCAGCVITLLLIFLVGFGGCVGLIVATEVFDNIQEYRDKEKSVQLFKKIKTRIANNQATATDYYLLARMVRDDKMCKKIGITELEGDKLYLNYLQQAINKGSQEAKLEYADFLFYKNENILDKDLDTEEKQAKYLKLKQALVLTEEVVNAQCEIYDAPYYPKFYAYPKHKSSVVSGSILSWASKTYIREDIQADYPDFFQLAEKIEKDYKKNCEKEKP